MVIVGNIIKTILEITDFVIPEGSPVKEQEEMLTLLLKKAQNTAFGKHYSFSRILKTDRIADAFAYHVPYFDYDTMHRNWWVQQMQGQKDVTWPGIAQYYALSAGTTGKESKHIPVTHDMLEANRKTSMLQVLAINNFDMPGDFFEKQIMMLGSSTHLDHKGVYQEGEISGIMAKNIPSWFERFYRPGHQIAAIGDWEAKTDAIARVAHQWDIGAITGIPSWNELMLKKVIQHHKVSNIHEIWPNLRIFASGGIPLLSYQKSLDALSGQPLTYLDTYLASEGFIAFQTRPNPDMAMALATNSGLYFEFVPFKEENIDENGSIRQGIQSYTLAQVQEGTDYILVVSSVAGAWRFMIGDTIRFTNKEKAEIIITGRTRQFLNVVGSQLSVIQMTAGIKYLEEKYNLMIPEFTVAAVRRGEDYIHHWYLGTQNQGQEQELAHALDVFLKDMNKAYKMARSKALKDVRVTTLSPEMFYSWNEHEKKKGGQVKMPKVMKEEDFARWEDFVNSS
ncbi:MAG: GH3 auxin-responsive promoter family protein [Bacteroidales bacterium]